MNKKTVVFILLIGVLTACSAQPAEPPSSSPTDQPAAPTQATLPTDTAIPTVIPTAIVQPTVPPTSASAQTATVSFSADVLPILQSRCVNCHGGDRIEEGLIMTSFADLMTGSENGPIIVPGDAGNSLMAELLISQKMPKRGPKLTPPQTQTIIDWINQGALEN